MKIRIFGHPRSGNHYLAALIQLNYLEGGNYIKLFSAPHNLGNSRAVKINLKGRYCIYIVRKFSDVAKSVFNIGPMFGLREKNYGKFLKTKYKDMWSSGKYKNVCKGLNGHPIAVKRRSNTYFSKINLTPFEYWKAHTQSWKKIKSHQLLIVDYDNLKQNFQQEMERIGRFLISNKREFVNVPYRVGWWTK